MVREQFRDLTSLDELPPREREVGLEKVVSACGKIKCEMWKGDRERIWIFRRSSNTRDPRSF